MDTRSKNSLNVRRLLSAAVLCVCAAVMLAFYPTFEKAGREEAEEVYEGAEYLSEMLSPVTRGNYVLYNEISRDEDESQIREELETSDFRRLEKYMDYSFFDDEEKLSLKAGPVWPGSWMVSRRTRLMIYRSAFLLTAWEYLGHPGEQQLPG